MAKQAKAKAPEAKATVFTRVKDFYQEVMAEMSKVTWPSQDELKSSTQVVLLMLAVIATLIYFYDVLFQVVVLNLFKLV